MVRHKKNSSTWRPSNPPHVSSSIFHLLRGNGYVIVLYLLPVVIQVDHCNKVLLCIKWRLYPVFDLLLETLKTLLKWYLAQEAGFVAPSVGIETDKHTRADLPCGREFAHARLLLDLAQLLMRQFHMSIRDLAQAAGIIFCSMLLLIALSKDASCVRRDKEVGALLGAGVAWHALIKEELHFWKMFRQIIKHLVLTSSDWCSTALESSTLCT